jgi:hypothetical protein
VQQITIQRAPRLWLALLGVVVLTAAAGLGGREIYRQRTEPAVTQPVVASSSSATPSVDQPGSGTVQPTEDAAAHPLYDQIRQTLQAYYDGINSRDYTKWRSAVTKARVDAMPESKFRKDYQSTKDGSILVYRIEAAPDKKLRVLHGFTSTQAITDAPPEFQRTCIQWHSVLSMAKEDNQWKVDAGAESASPQHDECGIRTS